MSEQYRPGETLSGVVDGMAPYGAFIELPDGRTGLCHISKLGEGWIEHPSDVVTRGQGVTVKVLRDDGQKIALAMERSISGKPLEPMLAKYIEKSRQRLNEYKVNRTRRLSGRKTG